MLDYFGMHAWLSRVPINEFTARLPRAVAVGVAAAGMIVLGKLVADRARRGSALWALYCLTLALAVVSFVYLGLLVFAHAVTLALGRNRRQLLPFEVAVAAALVLASPLIALAADQRLSWPGRRWCWSAGRPTGPAVPSRAAAAARPRRLRARRRPRGRRFGRGCGPAVVGGSAAGQRHRETAAGGLPGVVGRHRPDYPVARHGCRRTAGIRRASGMDTEPQHRGSPAEAMSRRSRIDRRARRW